MLAVAQMGIHLVFFLHITTGPDNTNNVLALAFGILIGAPGRRRLAVDHGQSERQHDAAAGADESAHAALRIPATIFRRAAMSDASVPRLLTFAGLPLASWAFALRVWIAVVAALYVAFWLQLEAASSAAVCVGILAFPTRGQAFEKAGFRFLATVIGVAVSIVLVGAFSQTRDLLLLAFAAWVGLCVYGSICPGRQPRLRCRAVRLHRGYRRHPGNRRTAASL